MDKEFSINRLWHEWFDGIILVSLVILAILAGKWWHDLPIYEKQKQGQTMVSEPDIMVQCTVEERMYLDALALLDDDPDLSLAQHMLTMTTIRYLAQDYPLSRIDKLSVEYHAKWALEYARTTKPSEVQSLLQKGVNNHKVVACMKLHAMSAKSDTYWSGLHQIVRP
jgi:hypothetical protein